MSRSPLVARCIRVISAIGLAATLTACADASATAPPTRRSRTSVVRETTPPDSTCRSGWVVVNGFWTCPT